MLQNKMAEWDFIFKMYFNIDKCFTSRVGRPKYKLITFYTLCYQNLPEADLAKYLELLHQIYNGTSI